MIKIDNEPFYSKALFRRNLIIVAILLLFLVLFFDQFSESIRNLRVIVPLLFKYNFWILNGTYRQLFLNELTAQITSASLIPSTKFSIAIFVFWLTFSITILIVAQFTLPVSAWEERRKARKSLMSFMWGKHGPAIFVKEGKRIARRKDIESAQPGVILVDLSSAVVLSQQENTQSWNLDYPQVESKKGITQRVLLKKKKADMPFTTVKGPGIVFTEAGEKIFSVLDLRKQSRKTKKEEVIETYTRNGIKVKSTVSVSFSLSDEPEILNVGYVSESANSEIRGLVISESRGERRIKIEDVFVLDSQDAEEIDAFIRNGMPLTYPEKNRGLSNSPYQFFPNRVWAAAHTEARSPTGDCLAWHQIPIELATDLFRAKLSSVPYDDLFNTLEAKMYLSHSTEDEVEDTSNKQVLKKIKDEFAQEMKRKGVLSFQVLRRKDGKLFNKGESLSRNSVIRYPILAFSRVNSNILRKSGVVILSASFGQITPIDPRIQLKMVENWKAKLDKEINLINAEYELEAVRVRNRNRAQIQQEMTYLLSSNFQSTHTEEALALRMFQALETAATNPANEDVSPKEILEMLRSMHNWLLVERKESSGQNGHPSETSNHKPE